MRWRLPCLPLQRAGMYTHCALPFYILCAAVPFCRVTFAGRFLSHLLLCQQTLLQQRMRAGHGGGAVWAHFLLLYPLCLRLSPLICWRGEHRWAAVSARSMAAGARRQRGELGGGAVGGRTVWDSVCERNVSLRTRATTRYARAHACAPPRAARAARCLCRLPRRCAISSLRHPLLSYPLPRRSRYALSFERRANRQTGRVLVRMMWTAFALARLLTCLGAAST